MIEGGEQGLADLMARLRVDAVVREHPPVHSVDEARPFWQGLDGEHTKNLFLKDNRGGTLYLVTVGAETRVDLKALAPLLGAKRLSFASPEALKEALGTAPGAVSPLSLVNDTGHRVNFAIERSLTEASRLTCHPLRNTATVSIPWTDLWRVLQALGVEPLILDL